MNWLKDNALGFYLLLSGVCAFVMAMLRTGGFTWSHFRERLTESLMCVMVGTALILFSYNYFHAPLELAAPISILVGLVGTDFIRSLIIGFAGSRTHLNLSHQGKKEEPDDGSH